MPRHNDPYPPSHTDITAEGPWVSEKHEEIATTVIVIRLLCLCWCEFRRYCCEGEEIWFADRTWWSLRRSSLMSMKFSTTTTIIGTNTT